MISDVGVGEAPIGQHPHAKGLPDNINLRGVVNGPAQMGEFGDDLGIRKAPERQKIAGNETPFKLRIKMSYFDGKLHIEDFLDYLSNVENFFECANIPNTESKIRVIPSKRWC